ncbi:phage integrase N-terminal SAM-like domain-containing protein [Stutzerimonas stutzeri]|uniref:phage integrase N-terminal SAM-like domain-containing protein n=1 Tax=Stutzerimonas stutzeri TaxID=316 RepID=UPI003013FA70
MRTERVYCEWVRRYIRFHGYRHPVDMGAPVVEAFLSDLAVRRDVSASTQNQALAALLFLYKQVLKQDLPWLGEVVRAKADPLTCGAFDGGGSSDTRIAGWAGWARCAAPVRWRHASDGRHSAPREGCRFFS